jgi:hypothetical protein
MPKRERAAIVLAGIYGGAPEDHLNHADEILSYAESDFTKPYKSIKDLTIEDVIS